MSTHSSWSSGMKGGCRRRKRKVEGVDNGDCRSLGSSDGDHVGIIGTGSALGGHKGW